MYFLRSLSPPFFFFCTAEQRVGFIGTWWIYQTVPLLLSWPYWRTARLTTTIAKWASVTRWKLALANVRYSTFCCYSCCCLVFSECNKKRILAEDGFLHREDYLFCFVFVLKSSFSIKLFVQLEWPTKNTYLSGQKGMYTCTPFSWLAKILVCIPLWKLLLSNMQQLRKTGGDKSHLLMHSMAPDYIWD